MATRPPTTTKSRSSSRTSISSRSERRRAPCWATYRCPQATHSSATLQCSPIIVTKRRFLQTFLHGHISQLNWQPTPRSKLQTQIRRALPDDFIESPHNHESFWRSNRIFSAVRRGIFIESKIKPRFKLRQERNMPLRRGWGIEWRGWLQRFRSGRSGG